MVRFSTNSTFAQWTAAPAVVVCKHNQHDARWCL